MIQLTPEGWKLADELNAGHIDVDAFFDKAIQHMIDNGLRERVGPDSFQITPKGLHIYHRVRHMTPAEHAVECAANMKLSDFMAAHDQLELSDEIQRILDTDCDVVVKDGIATARPKVEGRGS